MWRQLMELRRVKPLIVSVGNMAASGGYYLSCSGTRIFAEPTSIVGSIGVVGGKFSFARGMEHIGIHAETFAASEEPGAEDRAAYLSPLRGWDDATRARMLVTMTSVYDLFLSRVSEGRKIPKERVESFAEGRIFSGQDGLDLGMIDELGGLGSAVDYARRVAGLEPDAPVRLVGDESGLERLLALDSDGMDEQSRALMKERGTLRLVLGQSSSELLGFMGSLEPMLRGERALVAVPFAMLIR
jgi:protease-4